MSSEVSIVKPKRKPIIAKPDMIAPDNHPSSLPERTLNEMAHALMNGEYLQTVDCYWNPSTIKELYSITKYFPNASIRDYRFRTDYTSVLLLKAREVERQKLMNQEKATSEELALLQKKRSERLYELHQQAIVEKYVHDWRKKNEIEDNDHIMKEITEKQKQLQRRLDETRLIYRGYNQKIEATKRWKPIRRVVAEVHYSDHHTDELLEKIEKMNTSFGSKIVQVIRLRKEAMTEMNAKRGTPMRNVCWYINLTPMDYRAECSWTINRNTNNDYSGDWITHYLHLTEYDLKNDKVESFVSKERQQKIDLEEKEKAERDAEKEAKKVLKAQKEAEKEAKKKAKKEAKKK